MSFHFNSLVDTIFHLFASLPFSYTFKLTTCIRTILYLKIITSNNKVSEIMPSTSKKPFFLKIFALFPCITYSTCYTWSWNLLFSHGRFPRALYRESGLSQDRGPTPGTCLFFFKFYFSVFLISFFRWFINYFKESEVFCILVFSHHYTRKGLLPVWQVYPFRTLFNWGHASEHCWILTLLNQATYFL